MVYKIELSGEDVNLVGAALAEMPYGSVADLMGRLQLQITQQEAEEAQKVMSEPDIETEDEINEKVS